MKRALSAVQDARVTIAAVSKGNSLRVGDVVLRYNGEAVTSARQFYRLVIDSSPGGVARVEVELDTVPRV